MASYEGLLKPELLSRLSGMDLLARVVVEGFLLGLHRSPYRGFSVEFSQYRQYMPGDEIRTIDWKVYARTDRLYVKQYEEETNLFAHLLIDVSRSMQVAGDGDGSLSKFDYGRYLSAALAYLLVRQQDAVGLVAFDDDIVEYLPSRGGRGHLENVLQALERLTLSGGTDLGAPLHSVAERIGRRGLVIIVSDLQPSAEGDGAQQLEDLTKALAHLRFDGHEVILFHVLSPGELDFDYRGSVRFTDPETGTEVVTAPERVREAFLAALTEYLERVEAACAEHDVEYTRLDTSRPLDMALATYLATRQRLV
jgi:uncharacterized protein (DUF58 family)